MNNILHINSQDQTALTQTDDPQTDREKYQPLIDRLNREYLVGRVVKPRDIDLILGGLGYDDIHFLNLSSDGGAIANYLVSFEDSSDAPRAVSEDELVRIIATGYNLRKSETTIECPPAVNLEEEITEPISIDDGLNFSPHQTLSRVLDSPFTYFVGSALVGSAIYYQLLEPLLNQLK